MAPATPTSPESLAAFINAGTGTLIAELAAKLVAFHQPGLREPQSIAALARPRALSALYCLATAVLGKEAAASASGSATGAGASTVTSAAAGLFPAYLTATRAELRRLHPDWRGPFTFESTVQKGAGLYLRNAPNLTELVRSKPDYVIAEELDRVEASGDWLAIFALKAKIQFLEAMRIRTWRPGVDTIIDLDMAHQSQAHRTCSRNPGHWSTSPSWPATGSWNISHSCPDRATGDRRRRCATCRAHVRRHLSVRGYRLRASWLGWVAGGNQVVTQGCHTYSRGSGHPRELLYLKHDPVVALAGLAVGHAADAARDARADLAHHHLGVGKVNGPVEVHTARRHRDPPVLGGSRSRAGVLGGNILS